MILLKHEKPFLIFNNKKIYINILKTINNKTTSPNKNITKILHYLQKNFLRRKSKLF